VAVEGTVVRNVKERVAVRGMTAMERVAVEGEGEMPRTSCHESEAVRGLGSG